MPEKMFLNLLLLCGILSQGILETFADENIKESTRILDREKRVISNVPGEDNKMIIQEFSYIVQIKHNMRISCVGSILSRHVVITEPSCVPFTAAEYHVGSGSTRSDRGTMHNVTDIKTNVPNHARSPWNGIALVTVNPPFVNTNTTKPIEINTAPLLPNTLGIISGWGYNYRAPVRGTEHPKNLRAIEVPILAHQNCVEIYRAQGIVISEKEICTFHPQKQCGHTDGGAPLVVEGYLVGVHLTSQHRIMETCQVPEIFALLQHSNYKQWIEITIHAIETRLLNHH